MNTGRLSDEAFLTALAALPLVAIDLVVTDPDGRVLHGLRTNRPAKVHWFVPGGRVRKDERLDSGLARVAREELGMGSDDLDRSTIVPLGRFEHFYPDNAFGAPGVSTHYVTFAYRLWVPRDLVEKLKRSLDEDLKKSPPRPRQHSQYEWFGTEELENPAIRSAVHPNSLAYVAIPFEMDERQYALLNARRDSANNLVWQAPIVGLTGIAFLFTVLLAGDTSRLGRVIAATLAVLVCAASYQLTAKQRFMEETFATLAHLYEREQGAFELNARPHAENWLLKWSSVDVWRWLYILIAAAAIAAAALL